MSTIGKRLKLAREAKKITQEEIAKILGVTKSVISRYESGTNDPPTENLIVMAEKYGVSADYLLGLPTQLRESPAPYNALPSGAIPIGDLVKVPIYGTIRAGQPMLAEQNIIGWDWTPAEDVRGGRYFYLIVKGDSMIGARIADGDLVLVREQPTLESGQIGVFLVGDDEATVKRFHREGNTVVLTSENPAYAPIVKPAKEVRIIGEVVQAKIRFNWRNK